VVTGAIGSSFFAAAATWVKGLLRRRVCAGASWPRRSRRQVHDAAGEIGGAGLIGEGGRQGDFDAGDHLGDAAGHQETSKNLALLVGSMDRICDGVADAGSAGILRY
jgi:hypothetical protein